MRDENEVRKYRDNLRHIAHSPCDCGGGLRHLACQAHRQEMLRHVRLLTWVLGESFDLDWATEEAAAMAVGGGG